MLRVKRIPISLPLPLNQSKTMPEKRILILLTVIVVGLAVLRPEVGFWIREKLQGVSEAPVSDLSAEVVALKAELARREIAQYKLPLRSERTVLAEVYSRYPFGVKHELLVNAGEREGVQVGQPALFRGVFVGSVTKVFARAAVVETLFDVRAKYAVRIGSKGVDALLAGGSEPRLTLIANDAAVSPGAAIVSAAPGVPYGLAIGTVREAHSGQNGLFQEASVAIPYSLGELRVLEIMTDYVPISF